MYVRNGLSPDLATLLLRGQTPMTEEASTNSVSVTTDNGTRTLTAALTVGTGTTINTNASDKASGWDTVNMRNAAHVRDVEVSGTGSLAYTLTFTAGASASVLPVWSELPAPAPTVGDTWSFEPADHILEGDPAPEITVSSEATGYTFENGTFTFTPAAPGSYTFVFTAANAAGSVDATLHVSVTDRYTRWMTDKGYTNDVPAPTATNATSGQTYEWHYVTDISPTSDIPLEIVITNTTTFTIEPVSPNRYYQLLYTTNLLTGYVTTNLGWGTTAPIGFPVPGDWFGLLRVLLDAP
jgi:hypothetical protein